MRSKSVTAMALAAVVFASACAGRAPAPVAVVQPVDETMNCDAIQAESAANTKRIAELGSERGAKIAQNVAAGVVGLFIWPTLFLMDFQDAIGKEEEALKSRNNYLATLARQRCAPQSATQPSRGARS